LTASAAIPRKRGLTASQLAEVANPTMSPARQYR
jgi:hypothetical protein